jgi:hypothetical protein
MLPSLRNLHLAEEFGGTETDLPRKPIIVEAENVIETTAEVIPPDEHAETGATPPIEQTGADSSLTQKVPPSSTTDEGPEPAPAAPAPNVDRARTEKIEIVRRLKSSIKDENIFVAALAQIRPDAATEDDLTIAELRLLEANLLKQLPPTGRSSAQPGKCGTCGAIMTGGQITYSKHHYDGKVLCGKCRQTPEAIKGKNPFDETA